MQAYGFTEEDLREGLALIAAVVQMRLSTPPVAEDPNVIAELDAFENRWFQIARHTLARRYPQVAEALFLNLGQETGAGAAITVAMFLNRLAEMEAGTGAYGKGGPEARALLVQRGITQARVDEGRALLARLGVIPTAPAQPVTAEDQAGPSAELGLVPRVERHRPRRDQRPPPAALARLPQERAQRRGRRHRRGCRSAGRAARGEHHARNDAGTTAGRQPERHQRRCSLSAHRPPPACW